MTTSAVRRHESADDPAYRVHPGVPAALANFALPDKLGFGLVAEYQVGLNRIVPLILEIISAQLVEQADASPLLAQINENPQSFLRDQSHSLAQLRPAIASKRAQHVPCETFGVHSHKHVMLVS